MTTTPRLPKVGQQVGFFGVSYRVTVIEPETDWYWHVEAVNDDDEVIELLVPSGDEPTV